MVQIDIDMPEKCGLCPLFHAEHPMYCQGVKADRKKKIVAPYRQPRPDWCPLHETTADHNTVSKQAVIENVCTMLRNCFDASDEMIESVKITVGEMPPFTEQTASRE